MTIEHKERSMIDGQIHNIVSVANVISEIKESLEQRHGPLKRVSVAAAGRALKTSIGSMSIDISEQALLSIEEVNRLELAAVQKAQQQLLSAHTETKDDYYYCVGYSVLHFLLDGDEIGSLIDQSGRTASVEVIATFLPRVVVESLLAALKRANLEMEALTLEPIAAINVLIPPSMRRLNVSLVDIGAGTSDIAIANNNTVIAYGMVPIAGDEITEALSSHYLLDFPLAEEAKRKITASEQITITDILGFETEVAADEAIAVIEPSVDKLTTKIAKEIIHLNSGKSPQAVMVVGGGSLTPGLTKSLSEKLQLPENRVAVRSLDALTTVTLEEDLPSSPALVTPIGIAIASRRAPIQYMSVTVNDKIIRLFELKEMTVADALLAANVSARQLYGKPGLGMTITMNGSSITIPGEHGEMSTILLNGQQASTKDFIQNDDELVVVLGKDGAAAHATVKDLTDDMESTSLLLNGKEVILDPTVIVNNEKASMETVLQDRDTLQVFQPATVIEVLEHLKLSIPIKSLVFKVIVNGQVHYHDHPSAVILRQNEPIPLQFRIQNGDSLTIQSQATLTAEQLAKRIGMNLTENISVTFNNEPITIEKKRFEMYRHGEKIDSSDVVLPEDRLELIKTGDAPIVFSDVFAFTNYTLPTNSVGSYKLLRNNEPIGFHDQIFGGDQLQIVFS